MKDSDAMQLLKILHPRQNLKALAIIAYSGACLSNWLWSCANLVELQFFGMKNIQCLAALEGFVSLKTLYIASMPKLDYIDYKGCSSSTNFFPSLKELIILKCGRLRGWQREANVQNTRNNEWHHSLPPFSHLLSLQIHDCPNLSCMPLFPNLVTYLRLTDSSIKPLADTLSVSSIGASTSHDMTPPLSMLKSLYIGGIDIDALPEKWMQNLSSLKYLSITGFSSLGKPFRHMRNLSATLKELTIGEFQDYNLQCQDLCCLHSLQTIKFSFCEHLRASPEWICDLQSLPTVHIVSRVRVK
ncbi:uncharacterized protein LOC114727117 [Neltuma alba]|uniref:uncharacterized protein LOC114727117 n=1 Tax=Neltuma alba TaxID=207710 RepID=UPI0010A42859|nr:uncharacterized protein LOC114727117 [Prosopis alba]